MSEPSEKQPPLHVRIHVACLRGDDDEAARLIEAALTEASEDAARYWQNRSHDDRKIAHVADAGRIRAERERDDALAEVERWRGVVERVEALAVELDYSEQYDYEGDQDWRDDPVRRIRDALRAALNGPSDVIEKARSIVRSSSGRLTTPWTPDRARRTK